MVEKIQEVAQCNMIVPRNCRRKKCDIPHLNNGTAVCGDIIEKSCSVQFIKIIPHNITECPFVTLICIGVHNHPSPSPERTPAEIKNNLQLLIEQAIHQDDTITSRSLLSGKAYKNLHPFGQGVIGVYHNALTANSNLANYVRKIDLFTNNGQ
ncbi:hypothetical protein RhiirB3_396455, partial [Rhizophagus irregularis]